MKKITSLLLSVVFLTVSIGSLCSCSKSSQSDDVNTKGTSAEVTSTSSTNASESSEPLVEVETYEPTLIEIRSICQLATMECYFHDVCKNIKEAGTGITHIGEQDREFWFEYSAEATLGIDFSQVEIIIDGTDITVYYPHAEIIGNIRVDSGSTTRPICESEGMFQNSNEITAEDVTSALASCNEDIRNEIENDPRLLLAAEQRAELLIENYINQIMAESGVEYTCSFDYIENLPRNYQ